MKIRIATAAACATALAIPALAAPIALAKSDGPEVRRQGNCTAATDWKLKAKPRDGRLEVELEIDSNRNGQTWNWSLRRNGVQFAAGTGITRAPSGSFSVERLAANGAGRDTIGAVATNRVTGETCRGSLVI